MGHEHVVAFDFVVSLVALIHDRSKPVYFFG